MIAKIKKIIFGVSDLGDYNFCVEKIQFGNIEIEMHIHVADSKNVLIMYPGAEGSIDGYNQKYMKIANLLQSKNVCTVIRLDNEYCLDKLPYVDMMIVKLAHVIEYVNENSEKLTGHKYTNLYLAGTSAGASAIAVLLEELMNVKKVLLVAPGDSQDREYLSRGLNNYKGEVYLVAGEDDEIRANEVAQYMYDSSCGASKREIKIIPNCDHQFTGKRNGKILSNAYLWAFAGKGNFPSPFGGKVLYK